MRATDIIRSVLDLLDRVDDEQDVEVHYTPEPDFKAEPEKTSRFKQIFRMLQASDNNGYANTPDEVVSDVASVTTQAGGGMNGPKHPHDIRVKDPSMYPNRQEF